MAQEQYANDSRATLKGHDTRLGTFIFPVSETGEAFVPSLQPASSINVQVVNEGQTNSLPLEQEHSIPKNAQTLLHMDLLFVLQIQHMMPSLQRSVKDKALNYLDTSNEKKIVWMCIKGMMDEYCIHIKNHLITDFIKLLIKALNTGTSITCIHHVPRDAWIRDNMITFSQMEKVFTREETQDPRYCRFHRKVEHSTKDCYTLRRIFHEGLKKGEIITCQENVEHAPFPNHQGAGVMMACCKEIHDELSEMVMTQEDNVPNVETQDHHLIMENLLKTRLFQNFFKTLGFTLEVHEVLLCPCTTYHRSMTNYLI
ncbi:hypothetical protein FNV43_RR07383 [Rhamnella rubrinervis]|uniref:Uncharacterized protein n=1 Tax=Rhamnella rubrinervis TaxID=2594499 RepID=A0A8K0HGI2_9ROSA|nr:hypothetical protein FNV43_RR07383 [Rhamnella rubrinervis]